MCASDLRAINYKLPYIRIIARDLWFSTLKFSLYHNPGLDIYVLQFLQRQLFNIFAFCDWHPEPYFIGAAGADIFFFMLGSRSVAADEGFTGN